MAELEFEEILPFIEGDGDTGRTAREKINRNFTKIKPLANVGAEMQQLRQDVSDDLEQLHNDVEEMVDKTTSLFGYYSCSTAGATAAKTVNATGYELTNGGNIRIKMENANTAASPVTLQIGNATAKDLYYNGEPVSSDNTWEDNEVIVVYYDGEKYLATNSLGGGGNSQLVEELDAQVNGHYTTPSAAEVNWTDGFWEADGRKNDTNTSYTKCELDVSELSGSIIDIYATGTGTTAGIYIVKDGGILSREGLSKVDTYGKHWQYTVQDGDDTIRVSNKTSSLGSPYITITGYVSGLSGRTEKTENDIGAIKMSLNGLSQHAESTDRTLQGYLGSTEEVDATWTDGFWTDLNGGQNTNRTDYQMTEIDLTPYQNGSVVDIYNLTSGGKTYVVKKDGTMTDDDVEEIDTEYHRHVRVTVDNDEKLRVSHRKADSDASNNLPRIEIKQFHRGIVDEIEELKESGGVTASEITYNNTEGSLASTTVQDAIDELDAQIGGKIAPVEDMTVSWVDGAWTDVNGNYHELTTYGRCEINISNLAGSVIDIYARENRNIPAYVVKKNGTGINDDIICIDTTYLKHWQYTVQDDDDKLRVSNRYANVAEPYLIIARYTQGIDDKLEALMGKVDGLEVGQASKEIDLIMFMGQSNMAGRGITSQTWPNDAPTVPDGFGYEFKSISDPTRLYGVTKTFGVNENVTGAINDGTKKTGGLVPAFINSYYKVCKTPIVGVSASIGGTSTTGWAVNGSLLNDAINRLGIAVSWLTDNGYTIRHKYMAWCQGETDGDNTDKTDDAKKADYKTAFSSIFAAMQAEGIEKCFMIRIGEHNVNSGPDYTPIILAQNELCQENEDIVMVSTAFASMKERGLMKDEWHYYQEAYNQVGAQAGYWSAVYRQFYREGVMYDVKTDDLYFTQWSY